VRENAAGNAQGKVVFLRQIFFQFELSTAISTNWPLQITDERGNASTKAQWKVEFLRQIFLQLAP
jgi:hypothetical protein